MSRQCCEHKQITPMVMPRQNNNCICSFPTLVMLILIVLQFSRCGKGYGHDGDDCDERSFPVGNGILFIIALFYLSCVGCGTGSFGGYGAGYGAY